MAKSTEIHNYIWKSFGIPFPEREYKFHSQRKFRIDFAWPEVKLAVEIEGAVWTMGRHTRGSGFVKDIEKYNLITVNMWRLLRYPVGDVDFKQIRQLYDLIKYGKEM